MERSVFWLHYQLVVKVVLHYIYIYYRDSILGSLTKTLQRRMGSGGSLSPPAGSREDHEDSEFDIRKV